MNVLEAVAVAFGLACVVLTIRQNVWCWPAGLVQVALYIVIFYEVKLYSDLLLHVVYVGLQLYGWYHWLHGGREGAALPVTRLPRRARTAWTLAALVATAGWGHLMATYTDAALPYPDAFTTVFSLVAQWLMARKRLESWWFWIAVDIVAIGVYTTRGLALTAGLYAVFLVLAIGGLVAWRRAIAANGGVP